jgi:hypothetical protein
LFSTENQSTAKKKAAQKRTSSCNGILDSYFYTWETNSKK